LTPLAGRALPASQVSHHLFGRCKGKAIFQALQVFRQYSARFFSQNCPQTPVYKGFATSPLTTPLNNKWFFSVLDVIGAINEQPDYAKTMPNQKATAFLDWFVYSDSSIDGQSKKKDMNLKNARI
jgi:hypothetical protein